MMSEQKWTKEPWVVEKGGACDPQLVWVTSDYAAPCDIADLYHCQAGYEDEPHGLFVKDNAEENANRIVACVNACEGAPESIQPGAVKAMADTLEKAWDVMESAIQSGDWKVDGACDPSSVFDNIRVARNLYYGEGLFEAYHGKGLFSP